MNIHQSIIFLILLFVVRVVAQEPSGRIELPLNLADKSLSISQYKVQTQMMEGGGIRITYSNPTLAKASWINVTKTLEKPMIVSRVSVQIKTASQENPIAGIVLDNGAMFSRKMQGQGDTLSDYEADFAGMTNPDGRGSADAPAKAVTLTFGVVEEDGEKTIEIKNWCVE